MQRKRVLIVDDDSTIRDFLTEALTHKGHKCATAQGTVEARQRLSTEEFDTLLTDLKMPDGSGDDVMAHAKILQPGIRIILITGSGESTKNRPDLILPKPVALSILLAAID